ncbi:MAG: ABC transporter substrate-binding protein [Kordiimonadaceae bacterium]|jgi:iron complex transport system substrate-binding protein|nr:ABC transporter substrate-binding protein [Kordiimonadaceae bacterium]MBT6032417.1 ABC transporter substrate-binding protein [Kordiimonadaceae bacterium]
MKKGSHKQIMQKALAWVIFMGVVMPSPSFPADKTQSQLPRIVSLDYCSDQFVLMLADRDQIIAVSDAAEDIYSFYRDLAKGLPNSKSSIEEVIMLKPDVAVQTYSAAAHMAEMTKRTNIKLVATKYGSDPETVYENITMVGKALGQVPRADEFNKSYSERLLALKNQPHSSLKIAFITPSGTTAGVGTNVDDIIKLAGFESYAEANGFMGWLSLPIENLILDPPDMFITGFFEKGAVTQSNWSLSRHDYLFEMMNEIPTINLPGSMMSCNGLFNIDAAELIRTGAEQQQLLKNDSEAVK